MSAAPVIETYQQLYWADSSQMVWPEPMIRSIITDPPFGVDNKSKQAKTEYGKSMARKIENDANFDEAWGIFEPAMNATMPGMLAESDIYIFTSQVVLGEWLLATKNYFPKFGFEYKGIGLWEKLGPGMGDHNTWGQGFEMLIYFKRGDRLPPTKKVNMVFHDPQIPAAKLVHPHEKPVSLLEKFIDHSTAEGELVFDPFAGSFSLGRAARNKNRSALGCEIDETNYNMAMDAYKASGGLF